MAIPNEPDFALIKKGDGATPTEVFTALCGLENVSINNTTQTAERNRRDCLTPGLPGVRRIRATGKTQTITGSGAVNKDSIAIFNTALGVVGNYKIELYKNNGTGAGVLMGTYAASYMLTSANDSIDPNGDSSCEITLECDGLWTWTAAP